MDESAGSLLLQMQNYMRTANLALNGSHTISSRNCRSPHAYVTYQHFILIIKDTRGEGGQRPRSPLVRVAGATLIYQVERLYQVNLLS